MKNYMIYEAAHTSDANIVSNDGMVLVFKAILQEFDKPNRNGRIYPLELGKKMIQHELFVEKLNSRQLMIECTHPLNAEIARQMRIEPTNSVAIITKMWFEGNMLWGEIETLASSLGRDFRDMILYNRMRPAFSLRANGATKTDPRTGMIIVCEPIQAVTYDWVVTPSHIPAVMKSVNGVEDRSEGLQQMLLNSAPRGLSLRESTAVLMESAEAMMNDGLMTPIEKIPVDIRRNPGRSSKLNETYIAQNGDSLKSIEHDNSVIVESVDGKLLKMFAEEFIIKDIRNKIMNEAVLGEALDVDRMMKRLGVKATNKHGGGTIWSTIFGGVGSTKTPKDPVKKKFHQDLVKAIKKDPSVSKDVNELKKLISKDEHDNYKWWDKISELKKKIKKEVSQLAKDLRINQKTMVHEATLEQYTEIMNEINEDFGSCEVVKETLNESVYVHWGSLPTYVGGQRVDYSYRKRLQEEEEEKAKAEIVTDNVELIASDNDDLFPNVKNPEDITTLPAGVDLVVNDGQEVVELEPHELAEAIKMYKILKETAEIDEVITKIKAKEYSDSSEAEKFISDIESKLETEEDKEKTERIKEKIKEANELISEIYE